jgi:predicted alpha/beta hydrolase family esterase
MKKIDHVIILHGIGANPFIMWFPWLRLQLEWRGVRVDAPVLPSSFKPNLLAWKKAVRTAFRTAGPSTMVIGHSLGGMLAIRLLEEGAARRIGCLTLVSAPIARTLRFDAVIPFFDSPIDWKKVRSRVKEVRILHAKTDPIVPYDHSVRYGDLLGAKPRIIPKGGHFDGITNHALLDLIEPLLP